MLPHVRAMVNTFIINSVAGLIAVLFVLRADLHRRRLSFRHSSGWNVLSAFDVVCPAVTSGMTGSLLADMIVRSHGTLPLFSREVRGTLAGMLVALFLWREGRRQIQFQRPLGIVLGEWLVLGGGYGLLESHVFGGLRGVLHVTATHLLLFLMILGGATLIAVIGSGLLKGKEVQLILDPGDQ